MSRKITFRSLRRNTTYVLTIDDGSNTVVNLTPSATPFTTDIDNSEDFFAPVRSQSGTIEIVGEVSDVEPLLSSHPASRLVTLEGTEGSTTTLRWKGYLQTAALSQTWDKGPIPLSFPVVSHLGIIESYNFEETGYVSFAAFLKSINECTGTAFYTSFVFPVLTTDVTKLMYHFSGQAFSKWDDKTLTYEYSNYKNVLEEICKLFGWVAIEVADQLCFLAPDSDDGYVQFTAAQITTIAGGTTATGTSITQSTIIEQIDGADHTIDYIPGKKSVKVTGNPGNGFGNIFSFNVGQMAIRSDEEYNRAKSSGSSEYLHYFTKNYGDSTEVDVTYQGNIRYNNFYYDDDSNTLGSCCVTDRQLTTDNTETPNNIVSDTNWMNHIVTKPPLAGGNNVFSINPIRQHIASGLMSDMYLAIKFGVKRSDTYQDSWEAVDWKGLGMTVTVGNVNYASGRLDSNGNVVADSTCIYSTVYIPVQAGDSVKWIYSSNSSNSNARMIMYDSTKTQISFSNASNSSGTKTVTMPTNTAYIRASFFSNYKNNARLLVDDVEIYRPQGDYLMDNTIVVKDGTPYFSQAGYANSDGCVALIAPTTQSGPLHIQFNFPPQILGDYPYLSFENISVSYVRVWRRHLNDPLDENTTQYEIGNGFTESLEQSNTLTTQRPEFSGQVTSEQVGWGLVLDEDLDPIMQLYDSKYPEEALAGRMRDHYSVSKRRITAQLMSRGGLFNPLHLHAPGSGSGMVCLSQSVNWRDDQITASLFEI